MNYSYDLHIHSCISPCASDDMTPNNIVNMAFIKGLNIISVTDHNSAKHCRVIEKLANQMGILYIPGMEVQTREEVHVLCYFKNVDAIEGFDKHLEPLKSKVKNKPKAFGNQLICDENDEIQATIEEALILSVDIGIEDLKRLVDDFEGAFVPAHINKSANSLLVNLGFIPETLHIGCIEKFERSPIDVAILQNYRVIVNSDAHYLEAINEPVNLMTLEYLAADQVIHFLIGKG